MAEKKKFSAWAPAIAVPFIKSHEGCRLTSYRDPAGIWTIGYGSTRLLSGNPMIKNICISQEGAVHLLEHTLEGFHEILCDLVAVPVTRGQYIALMDFAYNAGTGALEKSTLLRKLNAGDESGAAKEFSKWIYASGKKLPGLVRRREEERRLFLK